MSFFALAMNCATNWPADTSFRPGRFTKPAKLAAQDPMDVFDIIREIRGSEDDQEDDDAEEKE